MKRILLTLLFLPMLASAQEHIVPIGTEGNILLFSVKNVYSIELQDVHVIVQSTPDWLLFDSKSALIKSIPATGKQGVEFSFSVGPGEHGRTGLVKLAVKDSKGYLLAKRTMQFRAELTLEESILFPAYPNPANPNTTICYALKEPSRVKLRIYNMLGRQVRSLIDEARPAGQWNVQWDGKNDHGTTVASGIYLIRLEIETKGNLKKLTSKVIIEK